MGPMGLIYVDFVICLSILCNRTFYAKNRRFRALKRYD